MRIEENQQILPIIPALEGLKVMALMLIVLRHAAYGFFILNNHQTHSINDQFFILGGINFYPSFINGWVGIDLFFVMCGFLIARTWLNNPKQSYKAYMIRRARRLLPLYYTALVLCYIGIPYYYLPEPRSLLSFLYHLVFLEDIFIPGINVALGSLAAEVKFYIFLPLVLAACMAEKRIGIALISATAFFYVIGFGMRLYGFSHFETSADSVHNYYMFFLYSRIAFIYALEPIILGVTIAWIERAIRMGTAGPRLFALTSTKAAQTFFYGGLSALLIWLISAEHLKVITWYDATIQPILTAFIMASIVYGAVFGGAHRWFGGGVLRHTAKLSYAAYLFHIPVIPITLLYTRHFLAAKFPGLSLTTEFLTFTAVYLFATWLVAEFFYAMVEKKFNKPA